MDYNIRKCTRFSINWWCCTKLQYINKIYGEMCLVFATDGRQLTIHSKSNPIPLFEEGYLAST